MADPIKVPLPGGRLWTMAGAAVLTIILLKIGSNLRKSAAKDKKEPGMIAELLSAETYG